MANYKGTFKRENSDMLKKGFLVKVKVAPRDIYLLTRIFEGYSHLGFAVPIDAAEGIVGIYTTPNNKSIIDEILINIPMEVEIL